MKVRIVALGSRMAGDDDAALLVAEELAEEGYDVTLAGRPGPSLLDHFVPEVAVVLIDVVRGIEPGDVIELSFADVLRRAHHDSGVSSHGLGVAGALELGRALGRPLPTGRFVGIGGEHFEALSAASKRVRSSLPELAMRIRRAVEELTSGTRTTPPTT